MAQMPNGSLVKGQYKPTCKDCAMYLSSAVTLKKPIDVVFNGSGWALASLGIGCAKMEVMYFTLWQRN